jgi:N-acetylglucosaminyl-diphospho-decaprenol L-rhamnosyltransferase
MVTVSIVSHGHGKMVAQLVEDLLRCPEVSRIGITQNVAEDAEYPSDPRLDIRRNAAPRGYGANHNAALADASTPFVCVLNPDIRLQGNPFPGLLRSFDNQSTALSAPKIIGPDGETEDSARRFPTVFSLAAKAFGGHDGTYSDTTVSLINPDWLAGMFLLMQREAFAKVGGFDEGFYLYYEDVDLCWRLRRAGYHIVQDRSVSVMHDARRESRRSLRFAKWHLASMARYLIRSRAF